MFGLLALLEGLYHLIMHFFHGEVCNIFFGLIGRL